MTDLVADELFARHGGPAGPTLVLVHGLAANAEVWDGLIALARARWPGRWIAPDLPGHGRSPTLKRYSYEGFAADVAALVEPTSPVTVLGHSMGGVVGLAMATGSFGLSVERVIGVGVKVAWTDEEIETMAVLAQRRPKVFADRGDAVVRGLRLAGLQDLVEASSPVADAGITEVPDGFRPAFDSAVNGIGAPPMRELIAASSARLTLARGELDPMVSAEQLRAFEPGAVDLPGLGHNAHVEDPELLWEVLLDGP